jgi:hypothetical protein
MIWIEFPANLSLLKEAPVEWTLDEKVWEQAVADLAQLAKDSSGERIEATVVGRLDTPERLEVSPGGNFATPTPNGYGHLNVYPARLVIKNIRDVKPAKR